MTISSNSTIASHAAITFVVIILTIATTVVYQVTDHHNHRDDEDNNHDDRHRDDHDNYYDWSCSAEHDNIFGISNKMCEHYKIAILTGVFDFDHPWICKLVWTFIRMRAPTSNASWSWSSLITSIAFIITVLFITIFFIIISNQLLSECVLEHREQAEWKVEEQDQQRSKPDQVSLD